MKPQTGIQIPPIHRLAANQKVFLASRTCVFVGFCFFFATPLMCVIAVLSSSFVAPPLLERDELNSTFCCWSLRTPPLRPHQSEEVNEWPFGILLATVSWRWLVSPFLRREGWMIFREKALTEKSGNGGGEGFLWLTR